mmetsp:Transcript_29653/g.28378  ORF Transcript_29653/g.28378 Transcript_29653/m.28378 type:complete len:119 (-) Transcript_29653:103-459(-)
MQRRKHKVASVERARDEGNIIVVAHLRRGDILKSNLWQERKRLVTFPFYKSLLNMLLQVRNDFFETVQKSYLELPISIFLLSEALIEHFYKIFVLILLTFSNKTEFDYHFLYHEAKST